jgi:hypothetical protein
VNETTVARMREGSCPTSTSSWNTSPVKLAAAPRFVARAEQNYLKQLAADQQR